MKYPKQHKAFTLVELLVVIAIIGILIALLLPAVQAAREAARRMQCTNNLKQVGVAFHNYLDANKKFPAQTCWVSSSYRWSALYAILPYIEQSQVYDTLQTEAANYATANPTAEVDPHADYCPSLATIKITAYFCPSDPHSAEPNNNGTATMYRNSISLCLGDVVVNNMDFGARFDPSALDVAHYSAGQVRNRAFAFPHVYKGVSGFPDGTSNTIAAGEAAVSNATSGDNRVKGGATTLVTATIWNSGVVAAPCLNARNGEFLSGAEANWKYTFRGCRWADGRSSMAGFCTILPPNSPNCYRSNHNAWGIYSGSSFHSGGMNTLFVDGSVHFIAETIDCGTKLAVAQYPKNYYSDPSPYGIWGALGTANGGETVSAF